MRRLMAASGVFAAFVLLVAAGCGLYAAPRAPRVPTRIHAGETITVAANVSDLAGAAHDFVLRITYRDAATGKKLLTWESREAHKVEWRVVVNPDMAGKQFLAQVSNNCPVTSWASKFSKPTTRTVLPRASDASADSPDPPMAGKSKKR